MTDPTFPTREALEAWALQRARGCAFNPLARQSAINDIRRVTDAHKHLMEDRDGAD